MKTLIERTSHMLELVGNSRTELAKIAGVKPPSVSDWLNGKTKSLQIEPATRLARSSDNSTVEIVIERQRRIEQHCLASARCYGSTGTALSNLFEWCLEDERE